MTRGAARELPRREVLREMVVSRRPHPPENDLRLQICGGIVTVRVSSAGRWGATRRDPSQGTGGMRPDRRLEPKAP